ncbi:uncharacterized protein LOC121367734 isoform X2 [Gigantopelta aegis]|uniref:uncharacterized protein LOC121367734 isoform X2 n=1 Tax=Gigantopelta aegis TaxID=1735272 RepID=UPI001B888CFF|nr:uncharacterized protein LOC121367734 isoform X2 [Gigantopelta aegis]
MGSSASSKSASPRSGSRASSSLSKEKQDNVKEKASASLTHQSSQAPKDLMISYSHADREMMMRIKDKLQSSGISVWVDVSGLRAGVDFLSKIGQAIIDAKLLVSLLSKTSVKSKYCKDELALGYVSNCAIFPVALESKEILYPLMDTGMKLQLASYPWLLVDDPDKVEGVLEELVVELKDELKRKAALLDEKTEKKVAVKSRPKFQRQMSRQNLNRHRIKQVEADETLLIMPGKYWSDRYSSNTIQWKKFVTDFMFLYKSHLEKTFTSDDQVWLMSILRREMEVGEDDMLDKEKFLAFCEIDDEVFPLWVRVQDQALESISMKGVFDMDSSVRVEAIENLGKYRSPAVIQALHDLLSDPDANVRAVAAVSLARTNASDKHTINCIMNILNDNDRLVREAGCLALGHLQAKPAVKKILNMWRNDVISHVRDAAFVALQQIGGAEVEREMHVTKVLADEIRQLTK